jgi:hypothetical protein
VETICEHLVFKVNFKLGVSWFRICLDAVVLIAVYAAENLLTDVGDHYVLIPECHGERH